jgi:hypothetical protein
LDPIALPSANLDEASFICVKIGMFWMHDDVKGHRAV